METKFKLGQKVWSIQLGDCEVITCHLKDKEYPILCVNKDGQEEEYSNDGYFYNDDFHPSLFSSNPFFEERVMEVRDFEGDIWVKRVVFMQKEGKFLAWQNAENIEESKMETSVSKWNQAREISTPQIVELTLKDISEGKGVGVPVELIRIKD